MVLAIARPLRAPLLAALVPLGLGACAPGFSGGAHVPPTAPLARSRATNPARHHDPSQYLKHIVIVIQENRSVDNLFNGFCVNGTICANTVTTDPVTGTPLVPESLSAPFDPSHSHAMFVLQYDGGKMDGFSKTAVGCKSGVKPCPYTVFDYVPSSETAIYRQLATVDGVLSDATFETLQGPSFPAHYYAIAGQSGGYDSDHWAVDGGSGTCASVDQTVPQILMTSSYPGKTGHGVPPCKDFQTIFDLLANAGHTWRYYSNPKSNFFSPTQSIKHLYGSPNFITPSTKFLTDVANGTLEDVTYVIAPTAKESDHPGEVPNPSDGPNWVASVINAVGETQFWNTTAIVVWWDDWGGLFDHVPPPAPFGMPGWMGNPDPFEYGFRVPLIVASPYADVGTVDHTPRTFVSALRLIEETFGLQSLGTTDQYEPDGLDSMFNFNQAPLSYTPLGGSSSRPFVRR